MINSGPFYHQIIVRCVRKKYLMEYTAYWSLIVWQYDIVFKLRTIAGRRKEESTVNGGADEESQQSNFASG